MEKKTAGIFGTIILLIVCFIMFFAVRTGIDLFRLAEKTDISFQNDSKIDNIEKRMNSVTEKLRKEQEAKENELKNAQKNTKAGLQNDPPVKDDVDRDTYADTQTDNNTGTDEDAGRYEDNPAYKRKNTLEKVNSFIIFRTA